MTSICEFLRVSSGRAQNYNLKRVSTGMLHIDRAHELAKCLYQNKPIPEHLHLAPIMPCHSAFAHRFGIQELPESDLMTALTPKSYALAFSDKQEHFYDLGSEFIQKTSEEHVKRTYPKLFNSAFRLAVQTFIWEKNLAILGSMFGIEHALINVIGLREPIPKTADDLAARIKRLVLPSRSTGQQKKMNSSESASGKMLQTNKDELHSRAVTSLIGACLERFGSGRTHKFLADRLLSAYLDPKQLVRSNNPSLDLAKHVQEHEKAQLCFRLLGESGRKSHNSMFIVGVYAGKSTKMLGEGYGASIYLAQQRAALDALRKIQLP